MCEKKMLLIVNPVAGRTTIGASLLDMIDCFIKGGYDVTVRVTQDGGDVERVISADGAAYDTVVCCGGDGTLSQAAGALRASGGRALLGYIPCGTVNDFATTHQIPKEPLEAARRVTAGAAQRLDLGYFGARPFVYVAAFGLFTEASYQTPRPLKNSLGKLAYLLEGAKSLAHIQSYHVRFTHDGEVIEDDFLYGMMTNSRTVGGFELPINGDAKLDDGLMEVTLIKTPKTAADRQSLINILITQKADAEHVYHFQTDRIDFECTEPLAWTVDGEFGGDPAAGTVEICHDALHMLL